MITLLNNNEECESAVDPRFKKNTILIVGVIFILHSIHKHKKYYIAHNIYFISKLRILPKRIDCKTYRPFSRRIILSSYSDYE